MTHFPAEPLGYFCLVLHAHLPFVRHPEYADPIEERWLHEAVAECYLPLLGVLAGWERDGVEGRLALSVSPTLAAMLTDGLLMERCSRRLEKLVELAESEVTRTRWLPAQNAAARHYLALFGAGRRAFEEAWRRDLLAAFAHHARAGRLELLTCNATHAFLPLFRHQEPLVRAQWTVAIDEHRRHFGRAPDGGWNAECGYYPGLDAVLAGAGLRYFFMDSHGLTDGSPAPPLGTDAPALCPSGVAVFGRDAASSRQVWNAHVGYPGDPVYREFYRDAGFDLEHDYIAPYVHESGLRLATGIKYHRVTGRDVGLGEKAPWEPRAAMERAACHGDDFVGKLRGHALAARARLGPGAPPPLVVAPYDAELFGHWWHEGPAFLDRVMRRLAGDPGGIRPTTPSAYLAAHPPAHRMQPAFSSWGEGGYAGPWLNHETQWIYPMVHAAGDRAMALARRHAGTSDPLLRRALNQMARELFLAQASDWAFMIHMGTNGDYPRRRVTGHVEAVERLARQVEAGSEAGDMAGAIDPEALAALETRDNLFPALRFEALAQSSSAPPEAGPKTT